MPHLHCPNCGKRIEIDSVGNFTARWSSQNCAKCGAVLSIRYDPKAMFVRFAKNTKTSNKKVYPIT
jgi:hypothetical protein